MRLLALVLAGAALIVLGGESARAADPGSTRQRPQIPNPDKLIERFPIGTERVTTTTPVPGRPPPAATKQEPSGGHEALWMGLAAGVGALGLLAALGMTKVRRRRETKQAKARADETSLVLRQLELALARREWDVLRAGVGPPGSRPAGRRRPVTEATHDPSVGERDQEVAGVGERVAAILEAAEAAAAEIRAEAVAAAAEMNENARAEATALLRKTEDDAARMRNDAEATAQDTRSAAESYGTRQRREAEAEAEKVLAEAETQARATRQAAEAMARQIEAAAHEREETLRAQIRPLEATVQRTVNVLRGVTTQLDQLLRGQAEAGRESLVEALDVSTHVPEASEEKV
jgi:hypothetical protein